MGVSDAIITSLTVSFALNLCACSADRTDVSVNTATAQRIVSLDFCADQYVLKLVNPDRILALSPDATKAFSYMRDAAQGVPTVRPVAEDTLVLQPDLIVRSYGGGPNATRLFERAGVPVVQIGWAGDLADIRRITGEVGAALGASEEAAAVIQDIDLRLAALRSPDNAARLLYITPSGTTTGPGSLIDALITRAGLTNFETTPGWRSLPLERMVDVQPDLIAAAFFDDPGRSLDAWGVMRHPVAEAALQGRPRIDFDSAWVSCGGWFAVDALEALNVAAQDRLQP